MASLGFKALGSAHTLDRTQSVIKCVLRIVV